jgi:hypothetical protein
VEPSRWGPLTLKDKLLTLRLSPLGVDGNEKENETNSSTKILPAGIGTDAVPVPDPALVGVPVPVAVTVICCKTALRASTTLTGVAVEVETGKGGAACAVIAIARLARASRVCFIIEKKGDREPGEKNFAPAPDRGFRGDYFVALTGVALKFKVNAPSSCVPPTISGWSIFEKVTES